ncbi:MAG: bacteriohopanetetrol glucosamine biosynthesis glycosyltransferase HpnI [Alphaproteobacteria bacterium]|nr:bacteriohopanetetrol glucosamine biosynthesis glycosyltransferase HpnI [Alphaproteobacteria bacterium]
MALQIVGWIALAAALAGAALTLTGALLVWARGRLRARAPSGCPPMTLLKPLHGAPPGLEEMLARALEQDYPASVQMICGLQSALDPARDVVERLQRRFPNREIVLVIDSRQHGANRKISNLINMMGAAKHDLIVVADADIVAPRNWLSAVAAAFTTTRVGVVSCFYSGEGETFWSRLGAMGISYQFLPNAVLGTAMRMTAPCFGATMALRRDTLAAIGGFQSLCDCLADDFELGRSVRARGFDLAYAAVLVRHRCVEASPASLWNHEFRWARTIRTVNLAGHWSSVITHTLPLALMGTVLLDFSSASMLALVAVLVSRFLLKFLVDRAAGFRTGAFWLMPVRDLLAFAVFLASLMGGMEVSWRGDRFRIEKGGAISQVIG